MAFASKAVLSRTQVHALGSHDVQQSNSSRLINAKNLTTVSASLIEMTLASKFKLGSSD